jgi:iron complex outermembrane receptor protein
LFITTDFFGLANTFIGGGEFFQSDFSAFNDDYSIFDSDNFTDIDRMYEAVFLYDTLAPDEKLSFTCGVRLEKEKFTFDYDSALTTVDDQLDFKEEAYEVGINYKLADTTNCFFQFARGFRIPKTDEYFNPFASPPVNKDLLPQTSKTFSLGTNTRFPKLGVNIDYFYSKLNNEIFLDPSVGPVGVNANYDKTERQGFNVSFELKPLNVLDIALGYRYTKAEFSAGSFSGKTIPMVPESKLNLSLRYTFMEYCRIFIDTVYRDKVFLVNDVNNVLDSLDSYWVTNLKLTYHKGGIELYAGVNNLFNEIYSEYASTNTTATVRGIYPSPERNYYWGIKYIF